MSQDSPFSIEEIAPQFEVTLEENPHKIQFPDGFVDKVFEKAREKKPLFNGTLVCVKSFAPHSITTYTVSFKEFLASHHLGHTRIHHPLAVSGWVIYRNQVLFGMRSEKVLFSPSKLELVPSGGVDESAIEGNKINYEYALINEFEQETGLLIDDVESIQPKLVVLSKEKQIYDICQQIQLKDSVDIYCDESNDEYTQFYWVPLAHIKTFVQNNIAKLHPTTLAIIEAKLLS